MVNSCLCFPIYESGDISHISPLNQIILIHFIYGKFFPFSVNWDDVPKDEQVKLIPKGISGFKKVSMWAGVKKITYGES